MSSSHFLIEKFIFHKQPTGKEVKALIDEHVLLDYTVSIEKHATEPVSGLSSINPYRWEVSFTKRREQNGY